MLTGYRVLDFTQIVAGPTCTRLLAELGAEIIKVELAPGGDRGRSSGLKPQDPRYRHSSQSTYFVQHNHSKKSLALDFLRPKSRELLRRIAAKADVVVENFAPGVMARAGLAYDDLRAINPSLVMCSISMAGQTGPLSQVPGFDYIAAAYAGIADQFGEADRGPAQIPLAIGDSYTGMTAAMAIAVALLHRERTGEGQYLEATLLDSWFHMEQVNVPRVSLRGARAVPVRAGSLHPDGGPTGNFRCNNDEYVAIMVLPHQWAQFVVALGRPDLADDPRFATARARRDRNAELGAIVEAWLQSFPSRAEAMAALERHRVPCGPVLNLKQAMEQPHLRARGTVRRVQDAQLGAFDITGMPAQFSAWPERTDLKADLLGEHNEEILHQLAGLSFGEIDALYRDGTIVRDAQLDCDPNKNSEGRDR
ncbi:MAG TPA: CoA transferase [Acetobacteraceae bacterium]